MKNEDTAAINLASDYRHRADVKAMIPGSCCRQMPWQRQIVCSACGEGRGALVDSRGETFSHCSTTCAYELRIGDISQTLFINLSMYARLVGAVLHGDLVRI